MLGDRIHQLQDPPSFQPGKDRGEGVGILEKWNESTSDPKLFSQVGEIGVRSLPTSTPPAQPGPEGLTDKLLWVALFPGCLIRCSPEVCTNPCLMTVLQ